MRLGIVAFAGTVVLILLLRMVAHRFGIVDHPGGRKQHEHPTPTVGGLAMFLAAAFSLCIENSSVVMMVLFGCAAGLVLLGTLDDRHDLNVRVRLTIQVCVALGVVMGANGTITHLGSLFGLGDIELGFLAVPFSVIAFVGGINAMNMIDGADGMAGKMAALSAIGASIIFYLAHDTRSFAVSIVVIGALIGFLLFNARVLVNRAWVFMGDAGSMWLGLVLGWFMAQLTHGPAFAEPALVLWLFGLPLVDTLAVILRRLRRNASPFAADRTHVHHVFQHNGLSVRRTVHLLSFMQCVLVGIGVCFYILKMPAPVVFGSFALLMAVYFYLLHRFHDATVGLVKAAGQVER